MSRGTSYVTAWSRPDSFQAYEQKEIEYKCPKSKRIYCSWPSVSTTPQGSANNANEPCQTFVDKKIPKSDDIVYAITVCQKCKRLSCLLCGARYEYNAPDNNSHRCVPANTDDSAFEGLERGKDYQICPSERCGMKIQLWDACNAMRCGCGTPFCYVCGEPARERSDHWARKSNGCPKWGPRGAPDARFEAPMRRPVLRFVEPPRRQRHPLDDHDHGPDGLRFAELRIADEGPAR